MKRLMNDVKFVFCALGTTALTVGLLQGPALAQKIDMKMGFITINDSQHYSAKLFAKRIGERTNGEITARIFPAGQLGSIPRQIEGMQLGTQEAFYTPPGFYVGINPAFQAADAPGLFKSAWHQYNTLNHPIVRDKFLAAAEHANIKGIHLWSAGHTGIATRREVKTLKDLAGLKLRVLASKVEVAYVKALGATGVPMGFGDVVPAIRNGTLDGTRIGVVVLAPSKFYTVAKHLYPEATGYIPAGLWVSKKWFEKLSARHQKAIVDVGRGASRETQQQALAIIGRLDKVWRDNGGQINLPSAADKAEMLRRAAVVSDRVLGGNPRVREMYALVKKAAAMTVDMKPPQ